MTKRFLHFGVQWLAVAKDQRMRIIRRVRYTLQYTKSQKRASELRCRAAPAACTAVVALVQGVTDSMAPPKQQENRFKHYFFFIDAPRAGLHGEQSTP